jgi:hypothetical protein
MDSPDILTDECAWHEDCVKHDRSSTIVRDGEVSVWWLIWDVVNPGVN